MTRFSTLLWLIPLAAGCSSASDGVCQNLELCANQVGQTAACQAAADDLGAEAADSGCGPEFDGYFGCANQAYQCQGNQPLFLGCEPKRAELDACLEAKRASNACGALATALAACPQEDAGSSTSAVPSPCTASGVCAAHCYLSNVPNVCAPAPEALVLFEGCATACP
ncbi:MAG: hypothetical protein ACYCWW_08470 [Deltaproteobacteria bacterium]